MNFQNRVRTKSLVELSVLVALEIIFSFTPLGYLRVGVVEITFMTIPVALGAMLIGPYASLLLGAIFGISSFLQCFGISAFGTLLSGISPFRAFLLCFFPRVLMGLFSGLIFRVINQKKKDSFLAFGLSGFSAAFLNTAFFVLAFFLLFRNASLDFGGGTVYEIGGMNFLDVLVFIAGVNGLVEAVACTLLSVSIGKVLSKSNFL